MGIRPADGTFNLRSWYGTVTAFLTESGHEADGYQAKPT